MRNKTNQLATLVWEMTGCVFPTPQKKDKTLLNTHKGTSKISKFFIYNFVWF